MKQRLEQLSGSEGTQERVIQIYIGIKNRSEFYQLVIDGKVRFSYPETETRRKKIRNSGLSVEHNIAVEIFSSETIKYEVINGYKYNESSKKIVKIGELPRRHELDFCGKINRALIKLLG